MRIVIAIIACLLAARVSAAEAPPACTIAVNADEARECGNGIIALLGSDGQTPRESVWRGEGSLLGFSVKQAAATAAPRVAVSFRFRKQPWGSANVWLDRIEPASETYFYKAMVPPDLKSSRNFLHAARTGGLARTGQVQIAILAADGSPSVVTVRDMGITKAWEAGAVALAAAGLGLLFVRRVAKAMDVPGDWLLGVISSRSGVASLSQLQVMLWTFVIGAGAVFVMALSGELIDISYGALVLLGIAGFATTIAKVKDSQDTPSQGNQPKPAAPDAVTHLALGAPAGSNEIVLSWIPAATGGPVTDYVVQFKPAAAPADAWLTLRDAVDQSRCVISNLSPGTDYDVQVFARNESGLSAAASVAQSTAPDTVPAAALARVTGLRATALVRGGSVALAWSEVDAATSYEVEYRLHQSGQDWQETEPQAKTEVVLAKLDAGETYDFRVAARARGARPDGPWSPVLIVDMIQQPRWADLVVRRRDSNEIDVPRLQMLFFTGITAGFVALKIIESQTIPEIPPAFQLLMGISNGLYLSAKFIPGK